MNNKRLGTEFEREMVKLLSDRGFWVHFITPDNRGAQPFDIIAAKDGLTVVGDCKTSVRKNFSFFRLENNQMMAFEKWLACGNSGAYVFVKYKNEIYFIPYEALRKKKTINLDEMENFKDGWWLK